MNDVYYIIVTSIFGLFVLLLSWWLYRYLSRSSVMEISEEALSDREKERMYELCSELRRKRLAAEAAAGKKKRKKRK